MAESKDSVIKNRFGKIDIVEDIDNMEYLKEDSWEKDNDSKEIKKEKLKEKKRIEESIIEEIDL